MNIYLFNFFCFWQKAFTNTFLKICLNLGFLYWFYVVTTYHKHRNLKKHQFILSQRKWLLPRLCALPSSFNLLAEFSFLWLWDKGHCSFAFSAGCQWGATWSLEAALQAPSTGSSQHGCLLSFLPVEHFSDFLHRWLLNPLWRTPLINQAPPPQGHLPCD